MARTKKAPDEPAAPKPTTLRAAMQSISEMIGRGASPVRVAMRVEGYLSEWSLAGLSERGDELRDQLVAGVEAAAETMVDVDREDGRATKAAEVSLRGICAARDAALAAPPGMMP